MLSLLVFKFPMAAGYGTVMYLLRLGSRKCNKSCISTTRRTSPNTLKTWKSNTYIHLIRNKEKEKNRVMGRRARGKHCRVQKVEIRSQLMSTLSFKEKVKREEFMVGA
jgi:hypothetical protein